MFGGLEIGWRVSAAVFRAYGPCSRRWGERVVVSFVVVRVEAYRRDPGLALVSLLELLLVDFWHLPDGVVMLRGVPTRAGYPPRQGRECRRNSRLRHCPVACARVGTRREIRGGEITVVVKAGYHSPR